MSTAAAIQPHHGLPRMLAGLSSGAAPMSLAEHHAIHGPLPVMSSSELIEAVQASGLRGRGGADFPTARKLLAVAARKRVSAVVVNGSETEPASRKHELLLSRLPHLVLDGAVLAASAVGAPEVVVRLRDDAPRAIEALQHAIDRRDDGLPVHLHASAGGYVSGEETAVVHHLNGGRPLPVFIPPRPFERGYRNRPTLVQNPETLAQLALVARFGPGWYRELGTDPDPGTALVTISGAVITPGVYEMAFGTPMRDLIAATGGPTEPLQALLVGGYFGTWVRAGEAMALRLAREDLRSVGCSLGAGVIVALGERGCGLHESARIIDYLAQQSAGQCGPCVFGLRAVADAVMALASGRSSRGELQRVWRWTEEIKGRGACHHPDGAVRFVQSSLSVFAHEIDAHRGQRCRRVPAGLPLGVPPAAQTTTRRIT